MEQHSSVSSLYCMHPLAKTFYLLIMHSSRGCSWVKYSLNVGLITGVILIYTSDSFKHTVALDHLDKGAMWPLVTEDLAYVEGAKALCQDHILPVSLEAPAALAHPACYVASSRTASQVKGYLARYTIGAFGRPTRGSSLNDFKANRYTLCCIFLGWSLLPPGSVFTYLKEALSKSYSTLTCWSCMQYTMLSDFLWQVNYWGGSIRTEYCVSENHRSKSLLELRWYLLVHDFRTGVLLSYYNVQFMNQCKTHFI